MNILLLGSGFIGSFLFKHLSSCGHSVVLKSKTDVDYTSRKVLRDYLKKSSFNFVINCSGYTGSPNVDACEIFKTDCYFYNTLVPLNIAQVCEEQKIKLINISSGCIYTGYDKVYTEKDYPNFGIKNWDSSFYSYTKHHCEEILKPYHCITLRIRMPFCGIDHPKNLITKILKYDKIIDLENSATCIEDLCEFVDKLLKHKNVKRLRGPINVVNSGSITGKQISEYLQKEGFVNKNWSIVDISELPIVANRSNCVLSDNLIQGLGLGLPPAARSLHLCIKQFKENVLQ